MRSLVWIALKDLRLLSRRRVDTFFVFLFPVVFAAFFTQVVSGSAAGASRIRVAVVDEDKSERAGTMVAALRREEGLKVALLDRDEAIESVRGGRRAAYLLVPSGFGAAASPRVTLAVDPARQGEAGLLRGLLLRIGGDLYGARVRAGPAGARAPSGMPLGVEDVEVGGTQQRAPVPAAVTLPQGVVWALLACAAAFGAALVGERTTGTLRRLRMAPLGVLPVLLGKGVACLTTMLAVSGVLFGAVAPLLGVEIDRYDLLLLALGSSGLCFVGLMLLIGTIGSSEDSSYRIGWAIILVLAMVGGAMVPSYLMPSWMDAISRVSPVRWSLLALEGAIWRGFGLEEMLLPCGVLLAIGGGCFALGAGALRVRLARGWSG